MPKHIITGDTYNNTDLSGFVLQPTVAKIQGKTFQSGITKGDMFVYDGTSIKRLSAGTEGQVLVVNTASTLGVQWSNLNGSLSIQSGFTVTQLTATAQTNTSSTAYTRLDSMVFTATTSGIYWLDFSSSGRGTTAAGVPLYGFHLNGNLINFTEREILGTNSTTATVTMYTTMTSQYVASLSTNDVVDIKFKTTAGDTFVVEERNLIVTKIS
jgi:hypothetical protein